MLCFWYSNVQRGTLTMKPNRQHFVTTLTKDRSARKKQIQNYLNEILSLLQNTDTNVNWNDVAEKHLIKIGFYQHERLIHLIVTVLFALLEVICVVATVISGYMEMLLLCGTIMILLIPYIGHYYFLENSVQKLYLIYDEIIKKARKLSFTSLTER